MIREKEKKVSEDVEGQTLRCLLTIAKDQEEGDVHADDGPKRIC